MSFSSPKFLLPAAIVIACLQTHESLAQDANPIPKVPKGDPAMSAAFARAASGLDGFFAKLRDPPPGAQRFSVKIGLKDSPGEPGYTIVRPDLAASADGRVEWFWVNTLRPEGAGFSAKIANDPDWLHNVAFGQTIRFARQDIGDWMYFQDGKIVGNATACPALAHASAEERREMKEKYGLQCE